MVHRENHYTLFFMNPLKKKKKIMSFYNTDEHTCEMVLERQQNKQEPIRSVCV